jgi:hypothetical protein
MKTPRVSVIIPVFNNRAHVGAAIRSVLAQSLRDFELIVVDDASSDGSPEVVAQFADDRIRLFRHSKNEGVGAARNHGLDVAHGEFVAPLDADDMFAPNRLREQVDVMERRPRLGLCGSWVRVFGGGQIPFLMTVPSGAEVVRASMLLTNPFVHSSVLLRRSVLLEHGLRYPAGQPAAIDYDLWRQCARVTEIDNIPRPLSCYRRNPAGITSRHGSYANQRLLSGLRKELDPLFPGLDDSALRFHAEVGHGSGMRSEVELALARDWLTNLLARNRLSGIQSAGGLEAAVAHAWFRVCRNSSHLGRAAVRAWFAAPWREAYRPIASEWAGFVASLALAKAVPSRRFPQARLGLEAESSP